MTGSIFFAAFALLLQYEAASAQQSQVPESLTAAELWNPTTWFYPFAIATAESYRDYYMKAQKATNDLYKQIYATNAFPWITGNWGPAPGNQPSQGGSSGQGGSTAPSESSQPSKTEETTQAPKEEATEAPKEETPEESEQGNTEKPADSETGAQVQGEVNDNGAQAEVDVNDEKVEAGA